VRVRCTLRKEWAKGVRRRAPAGEVSSRWDRSCRERREHTKRFEEESWMGIRQGSGGEAGRLQSERAFLLDT
jgi:hypothetical protein